MERQLPGARDPRGCRIPCAARTGCLQSCNHASALCRAHTRRSCRLPGPVLARLPDTVGFAARQRIAGQVDNKTPCGLVHERSAPKSSGRPPAPSCRSMTGRLAPAGAAVSEPHRVFRKCPAGSLPNPCSGKVRQSGPRCPARGAGAAGCLRLLQATRRRMASGPAVQAQRHGELDHDHRTGGIGWHWIGCKLQGWRCGPQKEVGEIVKEVGDNVGVDTGFVVWQRCMRAIRLR